MVFSFSLSLSLFSRACIRVPPILVPFTFPAPCLGRVLWVWQCLFYISCTLLGHTFGTLTFFDLLSRSVWLHCAWCMYIYIYLYMGDCVLCIMDSHGYVSNPLWQWVLLTLWLEYALQAIAVGAYSCHTVCIVTMEWLSRSMSASDISFPVYASYTNVFECFEGLRLVLAWARWHMPFTQAWNLIGAPNAKLCQIFAMKMGHPHYHIITSKAWWE